MLTRRHMCLLGAFLTLWPSLSCLARWQALMALPKEPTGPLDPPAPLLHCQSVKVVSGLGAHISPLTSLLGLAHEPLQCHKSNKPSMFKSRFQKAPQKGGGRTTHLLESPLKKIAQTSRGDSVKHNGNRRDPLPPRSRSSIRGSADTGTGWQLGPRFFSFCA